MDRVRLKFKSVSEILGTDEIGLLILTDEDELRQIAMPCDRSMIYQFSLRLNRAPVVGRLLPEVLWHVISMQSDHAYEILITDIIEGQYRALLVDVETQEPVSLRMSDAILLSYIGKLPIFIDRQLMEKQSVPYDREARGVAIPVNTISTEMLQDALDKAVEEEKYELASHLRDELRKRKGK
ncbi:MAG: bifunctional nuclease family protein [Prevotella sp.]|nr:bifunctional nuclease family protein [Prevotella sp.]MBR5635194.1 bifunctional nuclease family protein [Prevotella sp.]MBR6015555.1 bifunctional nuclease family protein [Prevotella sp.]MBR6444984.1 bifunctional nuclease family protein [Prevotella sp.]MBR6494878.1 bifunctional nuclease family protein [Prevotella sp.]